MIRRAFAVIVVLVPLLLGIAARPVIAAPTQPYPVRQVPVVGPPAFFRATPAMSGTDFVLISSAIGERGRLEVATSRVRDSDHAGVEVGAEQELAERLVQLRGDHDVLCRDVGVAQAPAEHARLVDG